LENALINLVVNARDAMAKGGSININLKNTVVDESFVSLTHQAMSGEFVHISVSDFGTGMAKQVLEKSIDPFFTTKSAGKGHGLGLSMVFGFVKQSDGHMTIDTVEGLGTTVSLYLPRHVDNGVSEMVEPIDRTGPPMGNGQTILLVEDEQAVQKMAVDVMKYLGYRTICSTTAGEALHKLLDKEQDIGLIVSDIVLPGGMNGVEFGDEVHRRFPDKKIMYISGYAQDVLEQCGADSVDLEVLRKPFSIGQLAERIAQRLEI
jgi:CheY-like chemotaxis protein